MNSNGMLRAARTPPSLVDQGTANAERIVSPTRKFKAFSTMLGLWQQRESQSKLQGLDDDSQSACPPARRMSSVVPRAQLRLRGREKEITQASQRMPRSSSAHTAIMPRSSSAHTAIKHSRWPSRSITPTTTTRINRFIAYPSPPMNKPPAKKSSITKRHASRASSDETLFSRLGPIRKAGTERVSASRSGSTVSKSTAKGEATQENIFSKVLTSTSRTGRGTGSTSRDRQGTGSTSRTGHVMRSGRTIGTQKISSSTSKGRLVSTRNPTRTTKRAPVRTTHVQARTVARVGVSKVPKRVTRTRPTLVTEKKAKGNQISITGSRTNANAKNRTSINRTSTNRTSTNRISTSRISTSRISTSRISTSRTSTNRISTDTTSTDRTSTSRTSTNRTSANRLNTRMTGTNKDKTSTNRTSTSKSTATKKITSVPWGRHVLKKRTSATKTTDAKEKLSERRTSITKPTVAKTRLGVRGTSVTKPTDAKTRLGVRGTSVTKPTDAKTRSRVRRTSVSKPTDAKTQPVKKKTSVTPTDAKTRPAKRRTSVTKRRTSVIKSIDAKSRPVKRRSSVTKPADFKTRTVKRRASVTKPADFKTRTVKRRSSVTKPADAKSRPVKRRSSTTKPTDSKTRQFKTKTSTKASLAVTKTRKKVPLARSSKSVPPRRVVSRPPPLSTLKSTVPAAQKRSKGIFRRSPSSSPPPPPDMSPNGSQSSITSMVSSRIRQIGGLFGRLLSPKSSKSKANDFSQKKTGTPAVTAPRASGNPLSKPDKNTQNSPLSDSVREHGVSAKPVHRKSKSNISSRSFKSTFMANTPTYDPLPSNLNHASSVTTRLRAKSEDSKPLGIRERKRKTTIAQKKPHERSRKIRHVPMSSVDSVQAVFKGMPIHRKTASALSIKIIGTPRNPNPDPFPSAPYSSPNVSPPRSDSKSLSPPRGEASSDPHMSVPPTSPIINGSSPIRRPRFQSLDSLGIVSLGGTMNGGKGGAGESPPIKWGKRLPGLAPPPSPNGSVASASTSASPSAPRGKKKRMDTWEDLRTLKEEANDSVFGRSVANDGQSVAPAAYIPTMGEHSIISFRPSDASDASPHSDDLPSVARPSGVRSPRETPIKNLTTRANRSCSDIQAIQDTDSKEYITRPKALSHDVPPLWAKDTTQEAETREKELLVSSEVVFLDRITGLYEAIKALMNEKGISREYESSPSANPLEVSNSAGAVGEETAAARRTSDLRSTSTSGFKDSERSPKRSPRRDMLKRSPRSFRRLKIPGTPSGLDSLGDLEEALRSMVELHQDLFADMSQNLVVHVLGISSRYIARVYIQYSQATAISPPWHVRLEKVLKEEGKDTKWKGLLPKDAATPKGLRELLGSPERRLALYVRYMSTFLITCGKVLRPKVRKLLHRLRWTQRYVVKTNVDPESPRMLDYDTPTKRFTSQNVKLIKSGTLRKGKRQRKVMLFADKICWSAPDYTFEFGGEISLHTASVSLRRIEDVSTSSSSSDLEDMLTPAPTPMSRSRGRSHPLSNSSKGLTTKGRSGSLLLPGADSFSPGSGEKTGEETDDMDMAALLTFYVYSAEKRRPLRFLCSSVEEHQEWISSINETIQMLTGATSSRVQSQRRENHTERVRMRETKLEAFQALMEASPSKSTKKWRLLKRAATPPATTRVGRERRMSFSRLFSRSKGSLPRDSSPAAKKRNSSTNIPQVSAPYNVTHVTHVGMDLKWTGQATERAFTLREKLGEGAFGSVHRAIHNEAKVEFAVKILNPLETDTCGSQSGKKSVLETKKSAVQAAEAKANLDELMEEIDILKRVRHPGIVGYFGCHGPDKNGRLWILMDLCAGSVMQLIENTRCQFTELQVSYILSSVVAALVYLHHKGIIHRDIKGNNILLTRDGKVKLADFGVAHQIEDTMRSTQILGSPLWLPPEAAAAGGAQTKSLHGKIDGKADVWALGITAIEIAEGEPPYANFTRLRVLRSIALRPPPVSALRMPLWSKGFRGFLKTCLVKNPAKRGSALQLLKHPFMVKSLLAKRDVAATLRPLLSKALYLRDRAQVASLTEVKGEELNEDPYATGSFDWFREAQKIADKRKKQTLPKSPSSKAKIRSPRHVRRPSRINRRAIHRKNSIATNPLSGSSLLSAATTDGGGSVIRRGSETLQSDEDSDDFDRSVVRKSSDPNALESVVRLDRLDGDSTTRAANAKRRSAAITEARVEEWLS